MADQGSIAFDPRGFSSALVALRAPIIQAIGAATWPGPFPGGCFVALRAPIILYRGASALFGLQDRQWPGGRDNAEGSPTTPCLRITGGGVIRIRIPVDAGSRSISVKAREISNVVPRPLLRVCENGEIGLLAALEATAPAGTGWVTVGPLTFTASAKGGVAIDLVSFGQSWEGECRWDSLSIT